MISEEEYEGLLANMKRSGSGDKQAAKSETVARPRPQPIAGSMNGLETRYSSEVLNMRKLGGELVDWKFEALKFRLAKRTFYTPDFLLVFHDRFEIHEAKGFWEEDARVKIKVAQQMFPWFAFVAVQHIKNEWKYERFTSV
jgi:hypothetical protein